MNSLSLSLLNVKQTEAIGNEAAAMIVYLQ